jgi:hypothetical protein
MNPQDFQVNANVIWNSHYEGGSILDVDGKGRLSIISEWNYIGRFIKWVRDWCTNGSVTERINCAVKKTLEDIIASNEEGKLVYMRDWYSEYNAINDLSPHYPSSLVKQYNFPPNHPISNISEIKLLVERLSKQSERFPRSVDDGGGHGYIGYCYPHILVFRERHDPYPYI